MTIAPTLGSRALFPNLEARAYLNHAAISPPSTLVEANVERAMRDYARRGVLAFLQWEEQRQVLRAQLAHLIGAQPSEVGFTANTSRGLSDLALCIPWNRGDRVLLFRGEFPANVTPWQRAAELFGLELVFLDAESFADDAGLELLEAELRRGVRLVSASVVQFQTGLRMPIRKLGQLCWRYGSQLCVDAIQACGCVPIDVELDHIDYLCTGSHKWLMGFEGAGFVFIRKQHSTTLRPYTAGWLSHEQATDFLFLGEGHLRTDRNFRSDAAVFEGGTQSLLALAALGASVPILQELGVEAIYAHVTQYLDALEPALLDRGFTSLRSATRDRQSGLLCVQAPAGVNAIEFAHKLREQGVIVATPDGKLRFSPHFPNPLTEVASVVAAVDACLQKP